jgi:hypothetical protein
MIVTNRTEQHIINIIAICIRLGINDCYHVDSLNILKSLTELMFADTYWDSGVNELKGYPEQIDLSLSSMCICGSKHKANFYPRVFMHCIDCKGSKHTFTSILSYINYAIGHELQGSVSPISKIQMEVLLLVTLNKLYNK